ncbi:MAG: hypothetical protein NC308_00310 [Clostridium sp.]|nr:methyltransferase [Bacteroides sp.]MCM1197309.1 hypothetical protein [Clostridium sp.]
MTDISGGSDMGIFRFKRFSVKNERSAMKVNTDGVLLGAAMTILPSDRTFLDVGTGTGTIALMAAQRISDLLGADCEGCPEAYAVNTCGLDDVKIYAIDIDMASAEEAAENFEASPWTGMLSALNVPLEDYDASGCGRQEEVQGSFDLIFSNPPYFESSLKAPDVRRRAARHAETMSYREILEFSSRHLSENGRVSMVLPAETETELVRYAASCGLYPFRILRIRSTLRKQPYRIVAEFAHRGSICTGNVFQGKGNGMTGHLKDDIITIQDGGEYTAGYRSLTSGFLLNS